MIWVPLWFWLSVSSIFPLDPIQHWHLWYSNLIPLRLFVCVPTKGAAFICLTSVDCVPLCTGRLYHTLLNGRDLSHLLLQLVVALICDVVSVSSVEVSGNVGPYEHLGSFFGEGAVSAFRSDLLLLVSVAIFENVLWIHAFPLVTSYCSVPSAESQVG